MKNTQYKTTVLDEIFVKNQFKLPEINKVDSKEICKIVDKKTDNIFDILGTYNPGTGTNNGVITMYTAMIEEFAKDLKVKYEIIYNIVYTHEVGHLYSHKAMDSLTGNSNWFTDSFKNTSKKIKEGLAQLFTHWEIEKNDEYLNVFKKMVEHQPDIYNIYKVYHRSTTETKSDMLEVLRIFRKESIKIQNSNFLEAIEISKQIIADSIYFDENLNKDSPERGKAALMHSGLFD
jgi:hypothetical protein